MLPATAPGVVGSLLDDVREHLERLPRRARRRDPPPAPSTSTGLRVPPSQAEIQQQRRELLRPPRVRRGSHASAPRAPRASLPSTRRTGHATHTHLPSHHLSAAARSLPHELLAWPSCAWPKLLPTLQQVMIVCTSIVVQISTHPCALAERWVSAAEQVTCLAPAGAPMSSDGSGRRLGLALTRRCRRRSRGRRRRRLRPRHGAGAEAHGHDGVVDGGLDGERLCSPTR